MKASLNAAAATLLSANKIVLAAHINPDGDTIGSMLALAHALKGLGKEVTPLSHHGVPEILRWLPGNEWVQTETSRRDFDLAVICDTGAAERVGGAREAIESARDTLCIDHHLAKGDFGRLRLINTRAAATGELVFSLMRPLRHPLSREIADCLMCALVTDTGAFRFMNVTPRTFRIAAQLMRAGANPGEVGELVFENRSLASIKLLGRAIHSIRTTEDGLVSWAVLRASDFEELGVTDEDSEGIVNHVRSVRTARVGMLMREIPGRKIRVSLRSREGFDVNRIAAAFGGGGHRLAAGCSLDPPIEAAEQQLLNETLRWLK